MNAPFDDLDLRIVGALLAHPRATNAQIAAAVFTSEATVSRRVAALLGSGAVRVIGVLDGEATRRARSVFVRLRCRPGHGQRTAQALAEWPETGSVKLLTGSVDCVAEIQYTSPGHLLALTRDRLPALDGVLAIWSNQVIRRFATPHRWLPDLIPAHLAAELRALRTDWWDDRIPTVPIHCDPLDRRIVDTLSTDGRSSWQQIADRCGVSAVTARRRAESLMTSGALRMRTVVEPDALGLEIDAFVALTINPTQLGRAGELLASHPAVLMMAATTGDRNLCGEVALPSDAALYEFLSDTIGGLPGLQLADVAVSLQSVKRGGMVAAAT
ncbi:Lrp/AsnC family transcriptional regulator [Microbacterium sp. Marseille-Q6965]|uniref:Lrp/AsnC family transcriptional regulator n=1 Tax=Microbacterium sp. Marseille-Q6965 TaxID=2965072 RepID=UPI0021B802EE|nr:Lrp/AsnC family transcriptional regulator [Microbacterium sp. Marseille-Q6965]